jgi:hypothetical protein
LILGKKAKRFIIKSLTECTLETHVFNVQGICNITGPHSGCAAEDLTLLG